LEQSPTPRADVLFAPRLDNPRVLFIREQTVEYSLSPGSANGETPVRQLTGNGETPQKQLSANGETPAKQSGAGSPATPGGPSTPGGPPGTPMSEGGGTPAEQTPQRNGETPVSAIARDKGKQPMREEGEGQQNGATNERYEPGPDVEALVPKLSQPDYYTEPKLQELAAKERAERGYMKRVPNFTVGRKGFGSVRFFGETDVRGLDLQSIIIFNDKEVIVYPDEDQKPDVGSGLNRPAEVTVLNVKRYDKKTGEAITQGPLLDKFERLLREKTAEQGATFISWDREKGEWKFRVEHFSRYGLDLDEDDDMELASAQEDPQAENAPAEAQGSELTFGNAQGLRGSEQEEVFSHGGGALAHSLPSQLGLDPLRMHQMRATLFAEDESKAARRERQRFFRTPAAKVHFPIPGFSPLVNPERATAQEEEPSETLEASGRPLAVWQRKRALSGGMTGSVPARRAPMLPITGPDVVPAKRARVTVGFVEEAPAVTAADSKAGVDAGLFLGRSFRVGWGPNGVLLHAGGGSAGENKSGGQKKVLSSQVRIEEVALNTTPDPVEWFVNPLQVHRQHAVQEEGGNGAKRLAMQCSREDLALLCEFYSEIAKSQAERGNGDVSSMVVARQEQAVWRLVDVLFSKKGAAGVGANGSPQSGDEEMEQEGAGPPPAAGFEGLDAGLLEDEDVQEMERRARLSEWIRENAVSGVERDLEEIAAAADKKGKRPEGAEPGSPMKEVLAYLTARNLEDAVGVAVASGDVRLATLIAQSGGSLEERADVARQVAAWEALHVDEHVDKDRLRVYKLLAGDVDGALEGALPVDWKRYLGLLLWYGLPPQASIPEVLSAYKSAWTRKGAPVPAPIPLYVEEGARLELPKPKTPAAIDTSYYLLLLYGSPSVDLASMQKMLRSASSTFDWLDYRLAWHLYSVLNAIGIPLPSSAEELHMNYAAQLAAAGLCEWAIYVALHIEDEGLREQSVKELLERHCKEWSEDEEKGAFLSEGLNIPQEWMHAAQVRAAGRVSNHSRIVKVVAGL
jgi:nuclear pore complex protein Nup98-Nup96